MKKISSTMVKDVIVQRKPETHKYNYGRVLLIGGNLNYGGAIIMSANAAVNSGAGLVTVASDPINLTSLHVLIPEATFTDYNQFEDLILLIEKSQVIAIGSGLGTTEISLNLLKLVFDKISSKQILIIDGSAFSLLHEHYLNFPLAKIILTPHQGEWESFSGLSLEQQSFEKNQAFLLENQLENSILVLKKHRTEIYYKNQIWQNPTGNASMATAGMGDTLAGMIAGFTAQFSNFFKATCAAVYLHGRIGDKLSKDNYVTIPTKISQMIPKEMNLYSV